MVLPLKRLFFRRQSRRCSVATAEGEDQKPEAPPPLAPVDVGNVILLGSSRGAAPDSAGSEHLGKVAIVVSAPDTTTNTLQVQLKDEPNQPSFPWPKSAVESLTMMLDDDMLSQIFSYLGESAASQSIFTSKKVDRKDVSNGKDRHVFAVTSIRDIARLHHRYAQVCKRWKQVCDDKLASIRGWLDADLIPTIGCNRLMVPALEWMCQYKLHIRSMQLSNAPSHAAPIVDILKKQDTSGLRTLRVCYGNDQDSDEDLAQAIVEECGALEKLHICFERPQYKFIFGRSPPSDPLTTRISSVFMALPVKTLTIEVDEGVDMSRLAAVISGMKHLQHVRLLGKCGSASGFIQIQSESMETLDLTNMQGCWVFCQCPKLESYSCSYVTVFAEVYPRGNMHLKVRASGSLPILSQTEFAGLRGPEIDFLAETTPFVGVHVPPSCVLSLRKCPSPALPSTSWLQGRDRYEDYQTLSC